MILLGNSALILVLQLPGKRRYDRKQAGFGGQTKPVFHKKVTGYTVFIHPMCQVHLTGIQWVLDVNAGQDNKEDCVEASMSVVQGCAHAPYQGTQLQHDNHRISTYNQAVSCFVQALLNITRSIAEVQAL